MKSFTILSLLCVIGVGYSYAQNTTTPNQGIKLFITGQGTSTFVANKESADFSDVGLHLMPLARLSDKLFLENEIEVETGEGEAEFVLEQVNLVYRLSPYLKIHAGRFLSKFGGYRGRMGEGFVSRFAEDPLGFGDGGIGPLVETGIGIQAGVPLGSMKMTYDIWLSDGPQVSGDSLPAVGEIEYEAFTDNNKNKAVGGRVSLLPFSNSSLEIGFSYENAAKTGPQDSPFEDTKLNMMAVDLNYFTNISALSSTLRVTGEWKNQDEKYPALSGESGFTNTSSAWYGVVALRPALVSNSFLRDLELAVRYSQFDLTDNQPEAGPKLSRFDIGLNYWMKWDAVLKLAYMKEKDADNGEFVANLVWGF